jgi:hypothetical protein
MPSYTVYQGEFICHTCKTEVKTLRLYAETKEMTWMCKDKHLSSVKFGKQKWKGNDREE